MLFSEDFDNTILQLVGTIELPIDDNAMDDFPTLTVGTKSWCSCTKEMF